MNHAVFQAVSGTRKLGPPYASATKEQIMRRFAILFLLLLLTPSSLRAAPNVSFADLPTGRAAIVDDPAYFDRLQPMEMEAKTGQPLPAAPLATQRAECRRRYQAAVREFTGKRKGRHPRPGCDHRSGNPQNYPQFAQMPWNFLKVSNNIEAEFPHTRGKHIVFAESVCRRLLGDRARVSRRHVPLDKMELLLHEQMHVFQRAHAEVFDSLYIGQWGFIRAKTIATCPWIVEHQLLNPDAVDCPWVFPILRPEGTQYIWPLCSLPDGPGPKRMQSDSRPLPFTSRGPATASACSKPRRPAAVFRADERAGLSRGLSAVDQYLSSARSVR